MWERFKCFSVKILDYYNITVHSLVGNKLSNCLSIYHTTGYHQEETVFLISIFRRVLNVLCFLLVDSPAFEFYMPTFRNTVCSIFTGS